MNLPKAPVHYFDPNAVTDFTCTAGHLAELTRKAEPYCFIRYGDGEVASILGHRGKNCDGTPFGQAGLREGLVRTLEEIGDRYPDNRQVQVGLHRTWHQERWQWWLANRHLVDRIRWTLVLQLQDGLYDGSTLEYLRAFRDFDGERMMFGPEWCRGLARKLGAGFLPVHPTHAQRDHDRVLDFLLDDPLGYDMPVALIGVAGMAAKSMLWDVWKARPHWCVLDFGHIADALAGRWSVRKYLRRNRGGIREIIRRDYREFHFDKLIGAK